MTLRIDVKERHERLESTKEPERSEGVAPLALRLAASPTRCPYCHGELAAAQFAAALVCERCLSRHHADCWVDACASCAGDRPLGRPARPGARCPARGRTPGAALMAAAGWGYLGSFALCFPALIPALWALPPPTTEGGELPAALAPFMTATLVTSGLSVLLWGLTTADAAQRLARAPRPDRWLAFAVAAASLLTGGLSGLVYFLVWGRRPLRP